MKRLLMLIMIIGFLIIPVSAAEFSKPAPPESVEKYMPNESVSFGKDLWHIFRSVLSDVAPEISGAMNICASVIVVQLLIAIVSSFSGVANKSVNIVAVVTVSALLIAPSRALITVGNETITSISEYNKVLYPVMTAALVSQGGTSTAATLYAGTVTLDTLLTIIISKVITPMLYAYIALGIASVATEESFLKQILSFIKWLMTWMLKIIIYVFTGYMTISGVISGTVDASALKATKIAISGTVPVIGNIISDASETVLIGAGILKNSVGVYGALVIIAIWIRPFLRVGIQYILLKITAGISSLCGNTKTVSVVEHISSALGFVLAMTGTACVLQLVSIVCYIKGMS